MKRNPYLSLARQFGRFLWARKLWWMLPIILVLFGLSFILVAAQGSALAPFIYTLF